jgi:hypothetical protein
MGPPRMDRLMLSGPKTTRRVPVIPATQKAAAIGRKREQLSPGLGKNGSPAR